MTTRKTGSATNGPAMVSEVAVAQFVGKHAFSVFVGALVLVLIATSASWLAFRHAEVGRDAEPVPPRRVLLLRALVGIVVVVCAGYAFAEMNEALDVRERMGRFDVALAETLRLHLSAPTLEGFAWVTRLGDVSTLTALCIAVGGVLLYRGQRTLAVAWVLAVAGNALLNILLKEIFERARPIHEHGVLVADGWSFPSGHSSGSVVAYGMLAYLLTRLVSADWRLPILMSAVAVAFTTGFSRVFLQVHYVSDVLAGFASGLLWLTICIWSTEWLRLRPPSGEGGLTATRPSGDSK